MYKIFLCLLFPAIALAQWSDDSQNNLIIADRINNQVQAKIVSGNDGFSYVSWFDDADGGYDVYLQRLDVNGFKQWASNGILVADRGYTSTQDYGLAIDTAGHALLTFRDDSSGTEKITANKISQTGDLLWGVSGIQVNTSTGLLAAPKIVGTSDGQVVVAWTQDADVVVQKLNSDGAALWGNGVVQSSANSSFITSDLQPSDLGSVIVSMVESSGFSSPKHLWAQKLAANDGSPLWGVSPLAIFDQVNGSLQFGSFPSFIADGIGGAVFTWYTSSPSLNCWVQRVDTTGLEYFIHNGIETASNPSQLRVSPSSAFNPTTQEIITFWVELDNSQALSGIYGQKFNSLGIRQWTNAGKILAPVSSSSRSFVQTSLINNHLTVAWINSFNFNNDIIEATQVNSDGNTTWNPEIIEIGSNTNTDSRLASAVNSNHFAMYVWSESSDVKAQNLNPDGTLGSDLIFDNGFE